MVEGPWTIPKSDQAGIDGKEGYAVCLVGLVWNNPLRAAPIWQDHYFYYLVRRTEPLEAGDRLESSSIGQQERCSVPLGQRQTPQFCVTEAKVARIGGFMAFAI